MWLASCSKLVTTVAALQCVECGLFNLHSSADVDRLLPEWSTPQVLTGFKDGQAHFQPAKAKITLAHLLTHTSGLALEFFPEMIQWRASRGEQPSFMRDTIPSMADHPLLFEPGTGWAYGIGLDLAGLMVARANSCTLEEYCRKNVFSILGMHDTSYYPRTIRDYGERLMPMVARTAPDESLINGESPSAGVKRLPLDPVDEYGGAGLWGTAADFLKLLKSLLRDDEQLLKSESVAILFEPAISEASKTALNGFLSIEGFASFMIPGEPLVGTPEGGEWTHSVAGIIGLTNKDDGPKSPWAQWGGAPNLKWWIDPNRGSCGIFATQLSPAGERRHQVLVNVFQREMTRTYSKA